MSSKILKFFEKNNLVIYANAIWQQDLRLKTWTVVWPPHSSRIRIHDSYKYNKKIDFIKFTYPKKFIKT